MRSCMREAWKELKGCPAAGQGWVGVCVEFPLVLTPRSCLAVKIRDIWCVPGYFPYMLHFAHVWNVVCTSKCSCGCSHSASLLFFQFALLGALLRRWGWAGTPWHCSTASAGINQHLGLQWKLQRHRQSVRTQTNNTRTPTQFLYANVVLAGAVGIIVHGNNHSPFAWVICVYTDGICISTGAKTSLQSR